MSAMLRMLAEGQVKELVFTDARVVVARLRQTQGRASPISAKSYVSQLVEGSEAKVMDACTQSGAIFRYEPSPKLWAQVANALFPVVILIVWLLAIKSLIQREERFTQARTPSRRAERTTFADVVSPSKVELAEIVDFLNSPEKYRRVGARIPRGALLVGPSGTGKTLLARAVAGEARCAFVSAAASEFVEVFVGRGASRVRDLFRQARDVAPAVLFLDELDAVGARSSSRSCSEHVQTLNQLLTELDGFHGRDDSLVVLAATNRYEAIDSALLRPGRFDRHVFVELPGEADRLQILKMHASRAPATAELQADKALQHAAANSCGFSGSELANVINEAIFLAMRSGKQRVAPVHLASSLSRAQEVRRRGRACQENELRMQGASFLPTSCFTAAAAAH